MDIEAARREMLELCRINALQGSRLSAESVDRLVELVEAVDEWLRMGGGLPAAWGVKL